MQGHVDQGELVVCSQCYHAAVNATRAVLTGQEVANQASKDCDSKRACTKQQQEGPPKKTTICSDQIMRTTVDLGSGSYGFCYLPL